MINLKKNLNFILASTLLLSSFACTTPTNTSTDKKDSTTVDNKNNSTTPSTNVQSNLSTKLTFTQKQNGVENPVGPEDIKSIVVNGVTIPASEIVIKSGFSTKAEASSDYQVTYEGAGKYTVLNKKTTQAIENNAIIAFNLLNSKDPIALPILKGVLDGNLRITYDIATGTFFGGITKEDGTIDNTKPVFKSSSDGKLVITEPSGNQNTFDKAKLSESTNLPTPQKTVTLTKEEVQKQTEEVKANVSSESPIANYIGLWLYNGLGQKIILTLKDKGQNKFQASATVAGELYSGEGEYNPNGKNDTLTLKVDKDQMHIEVAKVGDNALTLTLKSTSNQKLKPFQGAPVNLNRVRVAE
ncbi:MAG: hypothetical protein U0354_01300 [Candidatus Sericytochromatia bacterium]